MVVDVGAPAGRVGGHGRHVESTGLLAKDLHEQDPGVLGPYHEAHRDAGGLPVKTLLCADDEQRTRHNKRRRGELGTGNTANYPVGRALGDRLSSFDHDHGHGRPPDGTDHKPLDAKGRFALVTYEAGQAQEHWLYKDDHGFGWHDPTYPAG